MQIKTYEIEEVKGELGNMAADSEAIALINSLELDGQKELLDPKTDTRFPYPKMDAEQVFVYSTLFPEKSGLRTYNRGIIPLRVLQVAAFCKEQLDIVEVWHTKIPSQDPVLVGKEGNDVFLLARWGEALEDYEVLRSKALNLWRDNYRKKIMSIKAEIDAMLPNLEAKMAAETLGSMPTFWW